MPFTIYRCTAGSAFSQALILSSVAAAAVVGSFDTLGASFQRSISEQTQSSSDVNFFAMDAPATVTVGSSQQAAGWTPFARVRKVLGHYSPLEVERSVLRNVLERGRAAVELRDLGSYDAGDFLSDLTKGSLKPSPHAFLEQDVATFLHGQLSAVDVLVDKPAIKAANRIELERSNAKLTSGYVAHVLPDILAGRVKRTKLRLDELRDTYLERYPDLDHQQRFATFEDATIEAARWFDASEADPGPSPRQLPSLEEGQSGRSLDGSRYDHAFARFDDPLYMDFSSSPMFFDRLRKGSGLSPEASDFLQETLQPAVEQAAVFRGDNGTIVGYGYIGYGVLDTVMPAVVRGMPELAIKRMDLYSILSSGLADAPARLAKLHQAIRDAAARFRLPDAPVEPIADELLQPGMVAALRNNKITLPPELALIIGEHYMFNPQKTPSFPWTAREKLIENIAIAGGKGDVSATDELSKLLLDVSMDEGDVFPFIQGMRRYARRVANRD